MVLMVTIDIGIMDEKRKIGHTRYYADLDDTTWVTVSDDRIGNMIEYFQQVALRHWSITNGALLSVSLTITVPPPEPPSPGFGSDVEEVIDLNFPGFQVGAPAANHYYFEEGGVTRMVYPYEQWEGSDLLYYLTLLVNSTEALDWAGEYGGITDSRGTPITQYPVLTKQFRRRKRR